MSKPSEGPSDRIAIRAKIMGLGERSNRKSYYPQLQARVQELEEKSATLLSTVDELERARERAEESERRFRMLFEHIADAILVVDTTTERLVMVNESACRMLGYGREELLSLSLADIHPTTDYPWVRDVFQRDVRGTAQTPAEVPIKRRGGATLWIEIRAMRLDLDGRPCLMGVLRDITERKKAERARRELSRQRLEVCNVLAHELRNALIKIGFVFPAINSVMSFLREQWELELRKVFPDLEEKSSILMRLGELILMGQPSLGNEKGVVQLSEELLAEQMIVANLYLLPVHGESWLENKIKPKWHRLLSESQVWEKDKEEVHQLLKHLERAVWIVVDEDLARKMAHLPEDLRMQWPKLAYTEFSTANLSLLEDVLRLLDHPSLNIHHKQQLRKLLTSLKALADITFIVEDRMNRMLLSLRSEGQSERDQSCESF